MDVSRTCRHLPRPETAAAILDFQIFKIFPNSNLNTENSEKTTFSDCDLENCKIHCKIISI